MTQKSLANRTGTALFWKAIQLGGTKAIFMVRTLVMAYLLVPDDFGLMAISLIAVDFLLKITNVGMIPALVQQENPLEKHYNVAWTVGLARAILVSAVVILFAPWIAALFEEPRATRLIRVVAIWPIFQAAASIKVAELARNLRFRGLAFIYLPEALVNTLISVLLAPVIGVWALVVGTIVGPITMMIMSYIIAPNRPRLSFDFNAARPLIRFGQWIFATGLIAVLGSSMIQLVVSRRLGTVELGLYALGAKLAFIPSEISAEVVGAVVFPLYAQLQNNKERLTRAFKTMLKGIYTLLFPVCTLMFILSPSLVEDFLGSKWYGTVAIIQLLVLVNIIGLLGDMVGPILKGVGQPYKLAIVQLVQSSLLVAMIWVLAEPYGVSGAAFAWIIAVGGSQLVSLVFVRKILVSPIKGTAQPLGLITFISILGGVIAWAVDLYLGGVIGFFLAAILAVLFMGLSMWWADRRFRLGLVDSLLRAFPQAVDFLPFLKSGPSSTLSKP